MLLTSRAPPPALTLGIRDLASRLRAVPVVTLAPPDDALLRALIVKLAADRQLALDEALVDLSSSTASSARSPPPARPSRGSTRRRCASTGR